MAQKITRIDQLSLNGIDVCVTSSKLGTLFGFSVPMPLVVRVQIANQHRSIQHQQCTVAAGLISRPSICYPPSVGRRRRRLLFFLRALLFFLDDVVDVFITWSLLLSNTTLVYMRILFGGGMGLYGALGKRTSGRCFSLSSLSEREREREALPSRNALSLSLSLWTIQRLLPRSISSSTRVLMAAIFISTEWKRINIPSNLHGGCVGLFPCFYLGPVFICRPATRVAVLAITGRQQSNRITRYSSLHDVGGSMGRPSSTLATIV